jgi:hypothetical protein
MCTRRLEIRDFFPFCVHISPHTPVREIALPPSKITKNTPFKAETGVLQRKTASGRSSQADMRLFRFLNVHVKTVFLLLLRILTLTKDHFNTMRQWRQGSALK